MFHKKVKLMGWVMGKKRTETRDGSNNANNTVSQKI